MALRNIRKNGDDVLRKKCRVVDEITPKIKVLLDDMLDTMYEAEGVGLAAPQVGILKRIVVINIGEGPLKLINPEIFDMEGSVIDIEGCLSVPGEQGSVERPEKLKIKALDADGKEMIIEAEGLLARAACHEVDHLNGVLFIDKVIESEE